MIRSCYMYRDIVRGYKIRLQPTEPQRMRIDQILNGYIDAYNWSIETIKNRYKETNLFSGIYTLNRLIKDAYLEGLYWTQNVPGSIARSASAMAVRAFELYFNKHTKNRFPKFKSKKRSKQKSYHFRGERLYFGNGYVVVEGLGHGLKARIPCNADYIPKGKGIRYYNCTVSKDAFGYWLSVNIGYKKPFSSEASTENVIGIDLGIRKRAVLSNGVVFKGPNTYKESKRLRRLSIRYSKDRRRKLDISQRTGTKYEDVSVTKNEAKRELQYQKAKRRIANINNTYNHTMTKKIMDMNPDTIVLEDLQINSMVRNQKNRVVKGKIMEAGLYSIRRMIEYKAYERDIQVVFAAKNFPSSQICSHCGLRQKIGSSEVYVCELCGTVIDRDLNAAINLRNLVFK